MKKILFCFALLLVFPPLDAQDITGDWHGLLEVSGMKLRLVFHIKMADGQYSATMDSPDQKAFGMPVQEVRFQAPELLIKMPNILLEYKGNFNTASNSIAGTLTQRGTSFAMPLRREVIEKEVAKRPQHPNPPFPYYTEDVTYPNPAGGHQLAGTLSLPQKTGRYPVVILISGSGAQNRDEELLEHKPFLVIADYLTRQGIAVLRFDDRGVGKSTGNFATATSADFAADVLAGIAYLKTRPEIDPKKIGLAGHSEGGLIAPMVAAQSKDVAFIVLLAGPGVSGDKIILLQGELIARAEGQDETGLQEGKALNKKIFEMIRKGADNETIKETFMPEILKLAKKESGDTISEETLKQQVTQQLNQVTSPWFRYFLTYDPATSLRKVKCPVLALNGGKDLQVDPQLNIPAIQAALKKAKNKDVTTKILPGLNHLFQTTATGKPSEYAKNEETFSPTALKEMGDWIKKRVL